MKELAGSPIDDDSYELLVLQGLRALLGDERAQKAMVDQQNDSAAACEQVMAEAQARYDALTPEQREDPKKILEQVAASVVKLNVEFKFKTLGKSIKKITILSIIRSIPKVLKSFFIKQ